VVEFLSRRSFVRTRTQANIREDHRILERRRRTENEENLPSLPKKIIVSETLMVLLIFLLLSSIATLLSQRRQTKNPRNPSSQSSSSSCLTEKNNTSRQGKIRRIGWSMLETDVKPSQGRLSIPFHKLIQNDFLTTPVESRITSTAKKKWCLGVFLRRWEMNGSWNYALVCGWNDVVKANGLKDGDNISAEESSVLPLLPSTVGNEDGSLPEAIYKPLM
ncbi:hypothetical protein HID58_024548, partial [Brassica napus]